MRGRCTYGGGKARRGHRGNQPPLARERSTSNSGPTLPARLRSANDAFSSEWWREQWFYANRDPSFLPHEVTRTAEEYQGVGYAAINSRLRRAEWARSRMRDDPIVGTSTFRDFERLQNAILMAPPTPAATVLFRGLKGARLRDPPVGERQVLQGFQSFTWDPHIARRFGVRHGGSLIAVRIPRGTPMLWMARGLAQEERELLLPHGAVWIYRGRLPEPVLVTKRAPPWGPGIGFSANPRGIRSRSAETATAAKLPAESTLVYDLIVPRAAIPAAAAAAHAALRAFARHPVGDMPPEVAAALDYPSFAFQVAVPKAGWRPRRPGARPGSRQSTPPNVRTNPNEARALHVFARTLPSRAPRSI